MGGGKRRFFSSPSSFFLLLLVATLLGHRSAVETGPPVLVRVGVMVNLQSATGMRLQTTIRMAVEDYYAVHPNSTTRVELHFRDSPGDPVGAVAATEDLIKKAQVHAIVGPQAAAAAELVAAVGTLAHVPVLSYSATAAPPPPSSGTRFLVRTCADDSFLAAPVAALLRSFGWRAAVLVHEDSRPGAGILPALADAFLEAGARVDGRVAVPADASEDRLDAALLRVAARATRVVVVHASPALARRLLRRAKRAGMVSRGYAWLATAGLGGFLDGLTAEDADAMRGVVVVRPHVRPTTRARSFAARFKAKLLYENAGLSSQEIHDPTSPAMLRAYDTAWAVAAAADDAASTATPQGETLLQAVLGTTFDGIAGEFRLVDGQLRMPAYEILNVVPEGARTVGFWSEKSGISQRLDARSGRGLTQISWPGEEESSHSSVPRGWAASPNGKELVIGVPVKHGFSQFVGVSGDSRNGGPRVTGFCIDVFDAVMKALPYPVSYQYVPFNGSSDSYDQLVRLVLQQKAHAVVGDVTITSSRMEEVDYTMPFTESGWSMVVAVQMGKSTSMFFFLKPLTASLWVASFVFFVFTGFVVWVIEHRINPEFRGTPWQQFGLVFYYAFSTLVFAHREKLESNMSRFVVIIWIFVVLILTSSYTASLTSMLTVQQLEPTVTDVRELIRRGDYVGYQEGSFVLGELMKMNFEESKLRSYSTPELYAEALSKGSANGGVAAVFDEIPYLKLFLSRYCNGYTMAGPVYNDAGFGFVFPKGSPMTPDVSRAIVSLTEGDDMAMIERKWFGDPGACDSSESGVVSSISLSFWSFSGLFLITGVASGLMLVVYFATFVYQEREELRAAESGAGSVSVRRLRAWLQHYDRKNTRSSRFRQYNDDGSVRESVDAEHKNGAGEDVVIDPAVSRPKGSGDSDKGAAAPPEENVANVARASLEQRWEANLSAVLAEISNEK